MNCGCLLTGGVGYCEHLSGSPQTQVCETIWPTTWFYAAGSLERLAFTFTDRWLAGGEQERNQNLRKSYEIKMSVDT